jgi:dihydroorotase/N-acyl-D-amino-acid deacylase
MIETARASGIEVTLDFYPYTAGSTLLADILPPWALAGSPADMRGRLSDNSCRDALRKHFSEGLPGWQNFVGLSGWTNILLASSDWPERTSVAQAAEEKGCSEVDLVADVLLKDSSVLAIIEMMDPAEVDVIASVPYAMVGSDGIPMAGGAHPRLAGTFARLLASCGGDSFKLSQMVCRMTSLPASTFLIPNRGRIAVGYVADLVIFDPVSIQDRATYAQPLLGPIGVHHVLVNGQLVVDDGLLTAARPGKILEPAS